MTVLAFRYFLSTIGATGNTVSRLFGVNQKSALLSRIGWSGLRYEHTLFRTVSSDVLRTGLDRVGSEWTFAHLLQRCLGADVPGFIRTTIHEEFFGRRSKDIAICPIGELSNVIDGLLMKLGISQERRSDYLDCLFTQYKGILNHQHDFPLTYHEFCARWLVHELKVIRTFAPDYIRLHRKLDWGSL